MKPAAEHNSDYSASAEALNASPLWRARNIVRRMTGLWQIRRQAWRLEDLPPPVFVGAMGGSGTRAVAQILQAAGLNMGSRHNFALDAMEFVPFAVRWAKTYLTSGAVSCNMNRDFDVAAFRLRRDMKPFEAWGAKAPRFIYFLPYLSARLPGMKFIHVIRDGRDMALAPNQSQLHDYGEFLIDPELRSASEPVRSIALWNRINMEAANFGAAKMHQHYLLVRLENLCDNPRDEVERIFGFIGSDRPREGAVSLVKKPETTGRWKSAAPEVTEELQRVGIKGLKRFGYV